MPQPASFSMPALAFALSLSMTACAHTPTTDAPPSRINPEAIASTETYRPHELKERPQYTPQEVGRRFLKLANELQSFDQLSLEFVKRSTDLPFAYAPLGKVHAFGMYLPDSGWHYSINYRDNPATRQKNVALIFTNKEEHSDMEPVCAIDLQAYRDALTSAGYRADGSDADELGRLLQLHYVRNDVRVILAERREANQPESKLRHACLRQITLTFVRD